MKIACKNCGANVIFDPDNNNLYCNTCNTSMPMYELNISDVKYDRYHCNSCGAELLVDENTLITECSYCGSTELYRKYLDEDFKPEIIIPFTFSQKKVKSIFEEYLKKNYISKNKIKKEYKIDKIRGVYVPCVFWEYHIEAYDNEQYPLKDKPLFKEQVLKIFSFCDFSKKIPNRIIKEIGPYPLEDFISKNYNPIYTMGFSIEKGDEYSEKNQIKIKEVEKYLEKEILDNIVKDKDNVDKMQSKLGNLITSKILNIKKVKKVSVLVPIYLLNVIKKNKTETFAINGFDKKVIGKLRADFNWTNTSFSFKITTILFAIMIMVMAWFITIVPNKIDALLSFGVTILYLFLLGTFSVLLSCWNNIKEKIRLRKKKFKIWIYSSSEKRNSKKSQKFKASLFDINDKAIYINGVRNTHQIRREEYLRWK